MATDQLRLYNGALRACGEARLANLTEGREPRYLLDDVWADGAVDYVLSEGLWKFATRTVRLTPDPSISPGFGYKYAFPEPEDFIRTCQLSVNEYFDPPLNNFEINSGFWFCDFDVLYLSYVSNDISYGGDFSRWPPTFTEWVKQYLGSKIAPRVVSEIKEVTLIEQKADKMLTKARSKDAFEQATKFFPTGRWVLARTAGNINKRYDRAGW